MDQGTLVEGDAAGLVRVLELFRSRGLPFTGVYLIVLTGHDGTEERIIRLVTEQEDPDLDRRMIAELVRLRRENALPRIDPSVRFDVVAADDPEASRIIDYAQRLGGAPVTIRDAMWKGLFIEYALVGKIPQTDLVAA